jgi:lambda family phage tail tape measure protein
VSNSVIGKGVIEVSADSSKLRAGIDDAKRSIRSLGDANKEVSAKASQSIDRYVQKLEQQRKMVGMSTRESELYRLSIRGASEAQLRAADSVLRLTEAHQKGIAIGDRLRTSFSAFGAIAATSTIAAAVAIDSLLKKAGDFQDMAEKIGDTAENLASLAVAAGTGGSSMEEITAFSIRLTKGLTGVDDESKAAGAAIKALGIDLENFKKMKPADQMEALAKALNSFKDGSGKTAVMEGLGKGAAQLLPFLKALGEEGGRQVILTQKQIELADEYSDRQAKMAAQISLHAQAIATQAAPVMLEFMQTIADLAKDQAFAATASDLLKGAMQSAVVVFQTIAVVGSDLAFVFNTLGTGIDTARERLIALKNLDFGKFSAIGDAVEADLKIARANLDRFQAKVMSIGQASDPANYSNEGRGKAAPAAPALPELNFRGAAKKEPKGKDTAAQEAKAQLAFDLEEIRKGAAAEVGIYANAEKIMEALHSASLVDEKAYYAEKLGFIQLNSQAQEASLLKEIERMQAEKLAGKDKIDNDRKILDAQAKLAKVRADAATNIEVNSIQSVSANDKVIKSYEDAKIAAEAYLDTVKMQNAREVAGIGKGQQFRDEQAGLSQIEDKQTTERQGLERDKRNKVITQEEFDTYLAIVNDTYKKEVVQYGERTAAIKAKQADGLNGATEAMQNYLDSAANMAAQTEGLVSNAFHGMEDALVTFATTGKLSFGDLARSIIADMARIQAKNLISSLMGGEGKGALGGGAMGAILKLGTIAGAGGSSSATNGMGIMGDVLAGARASGGPVEGGKSYLVGEKGMEIFTPPSSGNIIPNHMLGGGGAGGGITLNPVYNIQIDSRSDRTQVNQDVQRAIANGNAQLVDQLSRAGKI